MQITNRHNLPAPMARALAYDGYDRQPGTYSVTALISPPRLRILCERHDEEIVDDVADRIWMLLGSAVHEVLDRAGAHDALQEERLRMPLNLATITGKPDLYEADGTVSDFKITSVWSVIDSAVKPEWAAQLNGYAALLRWTGFTVARLQIVAILRDWQVSKAGQGNYPPVGAVALPVPLWSHVDAEAYLASRLALHRQSEELPDAFLPECTMDERWQDAPRWAVMKRGRKSAVRLLESSEAAESMAFELGSQHYVQERPSEPRRCALYCNAAPWCSWWQAWRAANAATATEEE